MAYSVEITTVAQITEALATSLLVNTSDIIDSQRTLGEWRNESVIILKGRFGYYIRCGKLVAGDFCYPLLPSSPCSLIIQHHHEAGNYYPSLFPLPTDNNDITVYF